MGRQRRLAVGLGLPHPPEGVVVARLRGYHRGDRPQTVSVRRLSGGHQFRKDQGMVRRTSLILAALLYGLSTTDAAGAEPGMDVYVVEPAITNHAILPGKPLPPVCKAKTDLKITACRGEYEPASFVVKAQSPLESVMVEVSPLTGSGGALPADAIDVRMVLQVFRAYDSAFRIARPRRLPSGTCRDRRGRFGLMRFSLLRPRPDQG